MQEQKKIELLRFGGYIGASVNGLLVPILIYTLTGSAAFAGISMMIEWLPKLVLYILGGRLAVRWQPAIAHNILDAARIVALVLLYLCSVKLMPVYMIAVAAATYQCANAVSNILFENLVTRWWPTESTTAGHTMLLKRDIESGLVVLIFGLLITDPSTILLAAILIQTIVSVMTLCWSKHLHPYIETVKISIFGTMLATIKDCRYLPGTGLLPLAWFGLTCGIPIALFYSALPFYLELAGNGLGSAELIFAFGLLKTVLNLLALNALQRYIRYHQTEQKSLTCAGILLLLVGIAGIVSNISYLIIAGAVWISLAGAFVIPWARNKRQELLPERMDVRYSLTGVLIAMEALSYLVAAVLLIILDSHILIGMIIAGLLTCSGVYALWRFKLLN